MLKWAAPVGARRARVAAAVRAAASQAAHGATPPFGAALAHNFGLNDAPAIVTRTLQHAAMAATEIRVDKPNGQLSDVIPPEDAYMICLVLRDTPGNSYWEEGREYAVYDLRAGQTAISDLRRLPLGLIDKPIHCLLMYLPRATMEGLAAEAGVPHVRDLQFEPGAGLCDDTIKYLGLSLLSAMRFPDRANRLFTDHVALALASYCAQAFGGLQPWTRYQGGLAPWQERRAKEMLAADLAGLAPLHDIAAACGVSVSHFSRAFRRTTGLAPHGWLLQARVEAAKTMLRRRDASLFEIAVACGFADQSHFTRVFTQRVGLSPGTWRKMTLS